MKGKIIESVFKIITVLVLIINIIFLSRALGLIYLPGEITSLDKSKQAAQSVISYSQELANSYGVEENQDVVEILAKFNYEIERSNNADEIASLMLDYGRQTQDIIYRVLQNKRINSIFNIINNQELPESGKITISKMGNDMKILDPIGILTEESKKEIEKISFNHTLEINIENGTASMVPTGDIFNQVSYLQTKLASMERQFKNISQKAGYEPISGAGIIIHVYDNSKETEEIGIVHDSDIRKIINELLIAGAEGIEVGGQRLTVNSAIRCVGPTILVNNRPISVNPIEIKAIGSPEVLKSSLDIIKNQLKGFGIQLEIKEDEEMWIGAQSIYER
ncbi:DUF881 domain-containing protein [Natronospora cellulosivora (SeqCode)]